MKSPLEYVSDHHLNAVNWLSAVCNYQSINIAVLAELLTFSDCRSADKPRACGFGEFAAPRRSNERDVVLTALATTLLCEEEAAAAFICGPVQYLADVIPRTAVSDI